MPRHQQVQQHRCYIRIAVDQADRFRPASSLHYMITVTEYLSQNHAVNFRKPFMTQFLQCRVSNLIELYAHRNALEDIVEQQVAKLKEMNQSMVETLATIIEFRDCESGEHVKRIGRLTKIIPFHQHRFTLCCRYEKYRNMLYLSGPVHVCP